MRQESAAASQGPQIHPHDTSLPALADSRESDDSQRPSYNALEQRMNRFLAEKHRDLSPQERAVIYAYLLQPSRGETERSFRNVIRNDLMELLCWQEPPPSELAKKLIEVSRDSCMSAVTRDYAVQHLAFLYEKTTSQQDQEVILQALWMVADNDLGSISGTALLGIYNLQKLMPRADTDRLGEAALRLASSETVAPQSRITAICLCGQLGVVAIRPLLEEIVKSCKDGLLLRVAQNAIADMEKRPPSESSEKEEIES